MRKLEGKTAIITGCSGGIGKQIAIRYAEEGAKLAICARTESKLAVTAKEIEEKGGQVLYMALDVTDVDALKRFFNATIERYGTVDILVNNAVRGSFAHPFETYTDEERDYCIKSGFISTWELMKLSFPYLKEHGGAVINFGSGAGDLGMDGYAAYAATKEAIRGLTRVCAREWGKYNIRVNTLSPSAVTDNMSEYFKQLTKEQLDGLNVSLAAVPMGRGGDPYKDIAPVAVFLASEDSQWITGQNINAEGGQNIHG